MKGPINIFWFRRDLRLDDNAALYHALRDSHPVLPIFIFDTFILDLLENKEDSRVEFILDAVGRLHERLAALQTTIEIYHGTPADTFEKLLKKYSIDKVYANHDYEPYATERDESIRQLLQRHKASLVTFKDQVIFEKEEIAKDDGQPYVVYTPYSRRWLEKLKGFYLKPYPTEKYSARFARMKPAKPPTLGDIRFKKGPYDIPSSLVDEGVIREYRQQRDYPGTDGTSRIGVHLRFGTVSIRRLATEASKLSQVYLGELIWREFYMMILWKFPKVGKGRAFKEAYEHIAWRNNETEFAAWCEGRTGYPIVDAGMRQLNATGFMHNRVRMITASFLTKHLLIDWRWGEAFFAEKLLDYELASNNGGWQWVAGSGCDAAPYFRVFNPTLQAKKFDPQLTYIRRWVPELDEFTYPEPIVEHEFARKRCLDVYSQALKRELG